MERSSGAHRLIVATIRIQALDVRDLCDPMEVTFTTTARDASR
jgi:hypothetical protein